MSDTAPGLSAQRDLICKAHHGGQDVGEELLPTQRQSSLFRPQSSNSGSNYVHFQEIIFSHTKKMEASSLFDPLTLPVELWKNILCNCPQSNLAQMCLVHSQLLEISKDSLYSTLVILEDVRLSLVLPTLRNHAITRRIRHVILDPRYAQSSHLEEFLKILSSPFIVRLDIIPYEGVDFRFNFWTQDLLVRFTQLPQLAYLKLFLSFFSNDVLSSVLQTKALRDLDVSGPRLSKNPPSFASWSSDLPVLDTLRIWNYAASWRNLLGYVDLSRMKRLGLCDYDEEITDLINEWGGLVTASASTLENLSLWLTYNIIKQDIPTFIRSVSGFPSLHTLALFMTIEYVDHVPTSLWISSFLPILRAFHSCSHSLRHIRCYVHAWEEEYTYQLLLNHHHFSEFARAAGGLWNLETIKFSFCHSQQTSTQASDDELGRLAELFSPVCVTVEYGGVLLSCPLISALEPN
ncbi:hypothetical protein DL96DRAFT_1711530 [Flagelloscypha sp. PMI_526]|nr:hypothetical protein DL96DRAFT_1711530 [Flagelloscypha sp. PMI_526]